MKYDLPPEVTVEEDGPVRIVTLNRPDQLNAVNEGLHHGVATAFTTGHAPGVEDHDERDPDVQQQHGDAA